MIFVDYVRYYHREQEFEDLERAINRAIDRCIEEDILAGFLRENRTEVVKVTQLDYTFDRQIMLEREEAREEGREEGRAEGREEGRAEGREEGRAEGREEGREQGKKAEVISSVREGDYSIERGAEKLGITIEEFKKLLK